MTVRVYCGPAIKFETEKAFFNYEVENELHDILGEEEFRIIGRHDESKKHKVFYFVPTLFGKLVDCTDSDLSLEIDPGIDTKTACSQVVAKYAPTLFSLTGERTMFNKSSVVYIVKSECEY